MLTRMDIVKGQIIVLKNRVELENIRNKKKNFKINDMEDKSKVNEQVIEHSEENNKKKEKNIWIKDNENTTP